MSDPSHLERMAAFMPAAWRRRVAACGGQVHDADGLAVCLTGVPLAPFNPTLIERLPFDPDGAVRQAEAHYDGTGLSLGIDLEPSLHEPLRDAAHRAGLTMVEIQSPRSIDEIYEAIGAVGQAVSQEAKARDITSDMRGRIQKIQAQAESFAKRPRLYAEIDVPNWTVGGMSYTSEAIHLCGARNIFEDVQKPALQASVEAIFKRDPEIILSFDAKASDFARRPGWIELKAVRENKIIDDIGRNLLSHGNHRLVVGMEQLQARLLKMQ